MFPVDAFRATLEKIVSIFERHAIQYHLTGGIATVAYGEPRMTQDIDLVLDNQAIAAQLETFVDSLNASDFMFDAVSMRDAVQRKTMFQLLDTVEALKLDLYPREMIPGELGRSQWVEVFEGLKLPIASRADAAASKLVWISKGSHKSRRDLRQIYRSGPETDRDLIGQLARQLGLESLMHEVLGEKDELE